MTPINDVPRHVAIIMDGNGRWAESRNLARLEGHRAGAKSVRKVVEACLSLGVSHLTLFSFSTENWNRAPDEVSGLMKLFSDYLNSELADLLKNGIRLHAIGDLARLPLFVRKALFHDMEKTIKNDKLMLTLAVSYGGREEIVAAAKEACRQVENKEIAITDLTVNYFESLLWTKEMPEPDLLIRTSGEMRISNFLLWQLAYAEIVVTKELWPEFDENSFRRCIDEYRTRERRFGLTGKEIVNKRELRAEC